MKKFIVAWFIIAMIPLMSCAEPVEEKSQFIQWQELQGKANKEYREWSESVTANLTAKLSESKNISSTLQAELNNARADRDRLEVEYNSYVDSSPTREEMQEAKRQLGEARAEASIAKKSLEFVSNDYKVSQKNYLTMKKRLADLVNLLETVNDRTDLLTTSNLTQEKRDSFYEMWSLWYKTLPEVSQ